MPDNTVDWAGRTWRPHPLPSTTALHIAGLASVNYTEIITASSGIITDAGIDWDTTILAAMTTPDDTHILDLVAGILRCGTARPWKTTIELCRVLTTQWSTIRGRLRSTIRGRLIEKGIPDPLRNIPRLTALLDVVEIMLLDSQDNEDDRQQLLRDLYRRDDPLAAPPGWEDTATLDGII